MDTTGELKSMYMVGKLVKMVVPNLLKLVNAAAAMANLIRTAVVDEIPLIRVALIELTLFAMSFDLTVLHSIPKAPALSTSLF
ncbi:hypothetical protein DPMN_151053 [Dreissena polymorpha]|uniref:Uncharacterized protein n=1 Tax=Dreissena polymorpha TaxID=45954 RepID=A0A9D4FFR0_DREPO|nr:hypothetical protein DPMN_151053 [Dreissena polymorpha]